MSRALGAASIAVAAASMSSHSCCDATRRAGAIGATTGGGTNTGRGGNSTSGATVRSAITRFQISARCNAARAATFDCSIKISVTRLCAKIEDEDSTTSAARTMGFIESLLSGFRGEQTALMGEGFCKREILCGRRRIRVLKLNSEISASEPDRFVAFTAYSCKRRQHQIATVAPQSDAPFN